MKKFNVSPVLDTQDSKKVFLISIPDKDGKTNILKVCEDLAVVTGKYPFFMVQQVEFLQ